MSYQAFREKGPSMRLLINKHSFAVRQNNIFAYDYERFIPPVPLYSRRLADLKIVPASISSIGLSKRPPPPPNQVFSCFLSSESNQVWQFKYWFIRICLRDISYVTYRVLCRQIRSYLPYAVFSPESQCLLVKWIFIFSFLDAFAKFRNATVSFVISVRMFVRPSVCKEQPDSH
jgi:hypothetical protein